MGDIKILKLQSGEEIVGVVEIPVDENNEMTEDEIRQEFSNLVLVRGPMRVVYEYNELRIPHVLLYDWIPASNDDLFAIQKHQIITVVDASEQLEELYCQIALSRIAAESGSEPEDTPEEIEDKLLKKLLEKIDFDDDDIQQ